MKIQELNVGIGKEKGGREKWKEDIRREELSQDI